jgi:TolB-like protein/DNA-binding winged helix-turn-helix (wHTH) protein
MNPSSRYRFGPFAFDARGRVLFRDGKDLLLPPKAAETLAILLASAGQVVNRGAIHDSVWAGKFVGDGSLTRTISILRRALGGNDASQAYIATVSKRGYRFVAPLDCIPELPRRPRPALVLLPFENLGPGRAADAFCRGLSEEIVTALTKLCADRIGVIARRDYADAAALRSALRELSADHVLEGAVRCDGTRLRVTARLIQAIDETHRWAEQYERGMADALGVQGELAQLIVGAVADKLDPPARVDNAAAGVELPRRRRGDRPRLTLV